MVEASEIKGRIAGIRETKKITDAMYMISSAKMRRAVRNQDQTKPYFDALGEKIGELLRYFPKTENRYFNVAASEERPNQTHGILLITADKGLAGAYNQELLRLCESFMAEHPQTNVFIVGEYGRQYFLNKRIPFVEEFRYSAMHPDLMDARKICADLLEYYDNEKLDEISIIYTEYVGTRIGECKRVTLLPLTHTRFDVGDNAAGTTQKEFLPSPDVVLDGVIPSYLMGFIYGCLVESFCSEQQSRMIAMKSASDNADEMLKTLQLQYNKMRQASITNELIEITAGVRALKRRRKPASGDIGHEDE